MHSKAQFRSFILGMLLLALLLEMGATGQQHPAPSPTPVPFQWDPRKAEQVDYRHTIGNAPELSPADRVALIKAVAAELHQIDLANNSEQQIRDAATDMPIAVVDLNGDGAPDILAQSAGANSGCSPTGNCPFWVFQRARGEYSVLLESEAQLFRVQATRTSGFRDIVVSRHMSAFQSEVIEYKFDGTAYKASGCYEFLWGDADHEFQPPRTTP